MTEHPSGLRIQTPDLTLARPPRFAWAGRIVIGYLNLLLGNEGVGKGTLIAWLVALWSLGKLPGDLYGEPVNVGIIALEDSFNDVWVPRLHAAGADLSRIRLLERPDGDVISLNDHTRIQVLASCRISCSVLCSASWMGAPRSSRR